MWIKLPHSNPSEAESRRFQLSFSHAENNHGLTLSNTVIYVGALEYGVSEWEAANDVLMLMQSAVANVQTKQVSLVIFTLKSEVPQDCSTQHLTNWKHSCLWGMTRTVRNEHDGLKIQCVDLSSTQDTIHYVESANQEVELAMTGSQCWGRRLVPSDTPIATNTLAPTPFSYKCANLVSAKSAASRMNDTSAGHAIDIERLAASVQAQEVLLHAYEVQCNCNVL